MSEFVILGAMHSIFIGKRKKPRTYRQKARQELPSSRQAKGQGKRRFGLNRIMALLAETAEAVIMGVLHHDEFGENPLRSCFVCLEDGPVTMGWLMDDAMAQQ